MKTSSIVIIALVSCLTVCGFIWWQWLPVTDTPVSDDQVMLVTTIYPLADFATNIGGEFVEVINVVPAGAEPHDYEPSPRAVVQVLEADLLLYLGGGLDSWVLDLAPEIIQAGGHVLGVEDQVPFTVTENGTDPHIWLDPVKAQDIVVAIRDSLTTVDPEHSREYQLNTAIYLEALQQLDASYQSALADCKLNDIIVSHDAFGYLARRYDFNLHPISGLSPEAEPSVRDLITLTKQARTLGVKTIFFETLVSPAFAQTLAQAVGATTAVLNPLEGLSDEDLQSGESYLTVMEQNRVALSSAMLCQ